MLPFPPLAGTGKTLMARQIGKMLNSVEPKIVDGPGTGGLLHAFLVRVCVCVCVCVCVSDTSGSLHPFFV